MNQHRLVALLSTEARRVRETVPDTTWYLFGSAARGCERAQDIDILVLCESHEAVALVRHALQEACMRLPLHLFLITRDEESELRFIRSQGCVRVVPSCHDE